MDKADGALPDEQAFLERAVTDSTAFAAIYDHYFPRIYNYVRYRVSDTAAAEDLTSLVFEHVLAGLPRYRRERSPFVAWLFAIADHAVVDHLRRRTRRQALPLEAVSQQASPDGLPEERVVAREEREQILAAVASLGERERKIIALRFGGGLTNRRIAALTGMSEGHVAVVLYRALRKIRAILTAKRGQEE